MGVTIALPSIDQIFGILRRLTTGPTIYLKELVIHPAAIIQGNRTVLISPRLLQIEGKATSPITLLITRALLDIAALTLATQTKSAALFQTSFPKLA